MGENETFDLLDGIVSIAMFLGVSRRRAQYLHESGQIPTFVLGKAVCARRSTLTAFFADLEAKSCANRAQKNATN